MIEFQMGDAIVRVGDTEICDNCGSLNIWDGVCSDCGPILDESAAIERADVSGLELDDMSDEEQAFAAHEFGFDLEAATKKMMARGATLRSQSATPFEIHEYDSKGAVIAISQQDHPDRISARHLLPQWYRGPGPYQIFEGKRPITAKVYPGGRADAQV